MPTYMLRAKVRGSVGAAVEAESLDEAVAELRASVGVGAVRLGELPCGTPLGGEVAMDAEAAQVAGVLGAELSECQHCGLRWAEDELRVVRHLTMRVLPGEPMPSGECPECGAVCHPVEQTDAGVVGALNDSDPND